MTAGWHFECNCTGCTFPDKDSESTMDGYNCPTAGCDGALNLAGKFPAKSEGNIFSCSKCGNKVDCKAAISLASEKLSQLLRYYKVSLHKNFIILRKRVEIFHFDQRIASQ